MPTFKFSAILFFSKLQIKIQIPGKCRKLLKSFENFDDDWEIEKLSHLEAFRGSGVYKTGFLRKFCRRTLGFKSEKN